MIYSFKEVLEHDYHELEIVLSSVEATSADAIAGMEIPFLNNLNNP
jgi:hypothetical protein